MEGNNLSQYVDDPVTGRQSVMVPYEPPQVPGCSLRGKDHLLPPWFGLLGTGQRVQVSPLPWHI